MVCEGEVEGLSMWCELCRCIEVSLFCNFVGPYILGRTV